MLKQLSRTSIAAIFFISAFGPVAGALRAQTIQIENSREISANPKRVVSINPCADALLVHLLDNSQIASISHYSHNPRSTSISLSLARKFPVTSGTAEEILSMKPDIVVAGSYVAPSTATALKKLSIPLVRLSIPQSVSESIEQISGLAKALGSPRRGTILVHKINSAFLKTKPSSTKKIPALIWRNGGLVPGAGTLPDELLNHAGFQNLSKTYGLDQWDLLPLEHLVARPPNVLFSNTDESGNYDRKLSHPVLRSLSQRITILDYPARLLHCAGPTLIDAINVLAKARRKLEPAK